MRRCVCSIESNSRCVLASCCSRLRRSLTYLALLEAQVHATQGLLDPSLARMDVESSCVEPFVQRLLTVTALRHKTSVTRMMCSLNRVTSSGNTKVLLPCGAAGGLISSNIPGHKRRTSHKHCCMSHCRFALHCWDMSMNQSLTMLSAAWTLRRFAVLPLGSS